MHFSKHNKFPCIFLSYLVFIITLPKYFPLFSLNRQSLNTTILSILVSINYLLRSIFCSWDTQVWESKWCISVQVRVISLWDNTFWCLPLTYILHYFILFSDEWNSTQCMHHLFIFHSTVEDPLHWFSLLAIVNRAVMNCSGLYPMISRGVSEFLDLH